jgi:hypothetical protein
MSRSDPLIRRLADANPVPVREVEGASRSSAADEMLAALIGRERSPLGAPPVRRRRRRVAAAGVLLVSLVTAAVVVRVGGDRRASASEVLRRTAAVAAELDGPRRERGYLYSKVQRDELITSDKGGGWSAIHPITEELWLAADGSGLLRTTSESLVFFGERDRDRWEAWEGPDFASGVSSHPFPAGALPFDELRLLPTRPAALDAVLREGVSPEGLPTDVAVFTRVGELLARGDASPALRAALYRVAANLPGVELVGETLDPGGRAGVGVSMTYDESGAAVEAVMIFDQETSELLAQETILLELASWVDAAPGTRLSFVVYLEAGWTDSVDQTPA